ncbi:MAG: FtsX-like permease family protein [Candidatus Eisenbacteria bacterium]|uniref:FtsX-like permease family protein n=1 Tax=Eiseniibacteriota bacterium TaxID=2212470 RepID=A0A538SM75_UNCEI|nr:MAG: FtsX-like permease family protein [Candidatus Eisenbacteria bacterium]
MNRAALLRSALWSLLRNKTRSLLTVLGITIGIAAVICVVAVGEAGQAQVEQQLNNLGDNFVWIEEGGRAVNGVRTGSHGENTLTLDDVAAIKRQIPDIKAVSPNVDGSVQVIYGNQNWFTRYRGVSPEYFDIKRWGVDQGAAFTEDDVENAANVCAIGRTVRSQLFGAENPIGKVIRLGTLPCKVVATLQPKGLSLSGQDQDDTILMPYTVVQKKIKGNVWLDDILCSALSQDVVKLAGQEAAALLRDRHHLRPDQPDDFNIRNPEDIIQAQLAASRTLTILLVTIASISLLVGGIGIMNVMLVSVTERTREIGVRVAVGATEGAIRLQFLGESVMLSLVGGAVGVVLGIVGTYVAGRTLDWPMKLSPQAVIIAGVFSAAVGVFFGYYPARKASLLDPIEALRSE